MIQVSREYSLDRETVIKILKEHLDIEEDVVTNFIFKHGTISVDSVKIKTAFKEVK